MFVYGNIVIVNCGYYVFLSYLVFLFMGKKICLFELCVSWYLFIFVGGLLEISYNEKKKKKEIFGGRVLNIYV